jgi:hypothetical protein
MANSVITNPVAASNTLVLTVMGTTILNNTQLGNNEASIALQDVAYTGTLTAYGRLSLQIESLDITNEPA